MLTNFLHDQRGNFGIITALLAIPLFGAMGFGLDYAQGTTARSILQDRADQAAIAMARQGPTGTDTTLYNHIIANLGADTGLSGLNTSGSWTSLNEYTVTFTGKLPLTLSSILPASSNGMSVGVVSTARYKAAKLIYKPPTATFLDPEASDYNRVYAYCFNKDQKNNALTHGRSRITAIGDNAGSTYKNPMPVCSAGETMSFQLYNSRNAKSNKLKWDSPLNENYSYYTDTELVTSQGVTTEKYDLGGWAILETVLCNSLEECKPKSQKGILPEGKNRTPQRTTKQCAPGKFMYYGWEDRPPGRGSSDRDYDDIRIIIECPTVVTDGLDVVRLIK